MGCFPSSRKKKKSTNYLLQTVGDHKGGINCMTLSDDGSLLVTGSDDCCARMWSTESNPIECLGLLQGHTGYITTCVTHRQFVLTGSSDSTIRKWSIGSGSCLAIYEGHSFRISKVIAFGAFIFSTAYDKTARAWIFDAPSIVDSPAADQVCVRVFEGHTKGAYPLIFIPSEDNPLTGEAGIYAGDILVTGSADCTARSWSFATGKCIHVFKGHKGPVNCLAVDSEGKTLYTGAADSLIKIWNLGTGTCQREMKGHQGSIFVLQVNNRMLYSGSSDHTARSWVMEFAQGMRVYRGHKLTVTCMRYLDGMLYTGCGDTFGRMFEAKSGALKRIFKGHQNVIGCLEVIRGKLFTGSYDGKFCIWDTTGVKDDTIFGNSFADFNAPDEIENQEDSDSVKMAMNTLEPYIH